MKQSDRLSDKEKGFQSDWLIDGLSDEGSLVHGNSYLGWPVGSGRLWAMHETDWNADGEKGEEKRQKNKKQLERRR